LNLDQSLGDIGVVVENFVAANLVDDAVENVGVDVYLSSILIEIAVVPVFEEVNL